MGAIRLDGWWSMPQPLVQIGMLHPLNVIYAISCPLISGPRNSFTIANVGYAALRRDWDSVNAPLRIFITQLLVLKYTDSTKVE